MSDIQSFTVIHFHRNKSKSRIFFVHCCVHVRNLYVNRVAVLKLWYTEVSMVVEWKIKTLGNSKLMGGGEIQLNVLLLFENEFYLFKMSRILSYRECTVF